MAEYEVSGGKDVLAGWWKGPEALAKLVEVVVIGDLKHR